MVEILADGKQLQLPAAALQSATKVTFINPACTCLVRIDIVSTSINPRNCQNRESARCLHARPNDRDTQTHHQIMSIGSLISKLQEQGVRISNFGRERIYWMFSNDICVMCQFSVTHARARVCLCTGGTRQGLRAAARAMASARNEWRRRNGYAMCRRCRIGRGWHKITESQKNQNELNFSMA